jgi:hypothetical protein
MSEHELVEAYRSGNIGQVKFFRALVLGGMSVGAALSLALSVAPEARAVGEPPTTGLGSAAGNIANVGTNANASPTGRDNVVVNTGNAAIHLANVAANLPGSGNVPGGNVPPPGNEGNN